MLAVLMLDESIFCLPARVTCTLGVDLSVEMFPEWLMGKLWKDCYKVKL